MRKKKDLAIKIDRNALAFITHRLLKFAAPNKALLLNTITFVAPGRFLPPPPVFNAGHLFITHKKVFEHLNPGSSNN